jgi:hypothetical protein
MEIKNYHIELNKFGMLLINITDNNDKVVLYESKKASAVESHYCKQFEPYEMYYSGMFYDKKKFCYSGKMKDGRKIAIYINGGYATVQII